MRKFLCRILAPLAMALLSIPSQAALQPHPSEADPRIQLVDYDPAQIVELRGTLGFETLIEFAAKRNIPITPGLGGAAGLREDIIRHYAKCLREHGHQISPHHLSLAILAYVADSKATTLSSRVPNFLSRPGVTRR